MLFANILGIYKVIELKVMLCVQASLKEFRGEGCKRVKVINRFLVKKKQENE